MWYKIFMLVGVPIVVIGWIAYWLYIHKIEQEEKGKPRDASKRLKESRGEVADWAKKMAEFQPPKRKKKAGTAPPGHDQS